MTTHIVWLVIRLNKIISELAEYNQKNKSRQVFAVTAYEKAGELTLAELKKRVKSHLLNGLRSHSQLASLSQMHERLINHALTLIENLENRQQGIALFFQFNAEKLEREAPKNLKNVDDTLISKIVPLYVEPETHIYVGKIFDFTPMFRYLRMTPLALIAQVENQQAEIFLLTGATIKPLVKLENKHNEPTAKEYREIHRPNKQGMIQHGTGEENVARRQISANKVFLDEVGAEIEKTFKKNGWKNLLVYASENYRPFIERWVEKFKDATQFPPLVEYKFFKEKNSLKEDALVRLAKYNKEIIKNNFSQETENFKHFVSGWKDVANAVRESRVQKLYISLDQTKKRPGYILNHELPYSYPVNEAKKVNNLLPWLTQAVIVAGGEIIAAHTLEDSGKYQIAAKLRYSE